MQYRSRTRTIVVSICFALVLSVAISTLKGTSQTLMRVSYIDVGQGDAILIQTGENFDVLIDAGRPSNGPTVVAYLHQAGIDSLEAIVATHSDDDHIGGIVRVLEEESISVGQVLYNGYPGDTNTLAEIHQAARDRGIPIVAAQFPTVYNWGGVEVHVLNPAPGEIGKEDNDLSVVLLFDQDDVEYLFAADMGDTVEATVVARLTPIAADILKVGHHGSKYASTAHFLSAVGPTEAIITVGSTNPYGHPAPETIERLTQAGASIWRTDQLGTITVVSNGTHWAVNKELLAVLSVYLPLVVAQQAPATPTPTTVIIMPTETPTLTPTATEIVPTDTPIPTATATATSVPSGQVVISDIFYDGVVPRVESDEYAVITNVGSSPQNLQGWKLNAGNPGQDFIFPNFTLNAGQSCRVYTNEIHPEWCGFSFGSGTALWSNSEDCGFLYNQGGGLVSQRCY